MEGDTTTHRRSPRRPALALALAALALAPAALAGGGGPDDEHRIAEALCRHADPREMLLGTAAAAGFAPAADAIHAVDLGADLPSALAALYAALGLPVTDLTLLSLEARAAALGHDVAAPVAVLVQALADAAALNTRAWAPLDADERAALLAALASGDDPHAWPPAATKAAARVDASHQVAAAALLLDATDAARPMVLAAVEAGHWPRAGAIADPAGLVRVGGTGDDYETMDRVLAVDPAGNDTYRGRVGGADVGGYIAPPFVGPPVGLAWDLAGDDVYDVRTGAAALGAGAGGVGVLLDEAGDDAYDTTRELSLGAGQIGVGLFADLAGDDMYGRFGDGLGVGHGAGLGLALEAAGDDRYDVTYFTLGHATGASHQIAGFFCDRAGSDAYAAEGYSIGFADVAKARGWFADIGGTPDAYAGRGAGPAADGRYWTHGVLGGVGHGLDA